MPGKNKKCLAVISTMCKLLGSIFWWNCLEFSHKFNLNIQLTIFNNVKYRQAICLKFEDRLFTYLTTLGLQEKASICSTIKENL